MSQPQTVRELVIDPCVIFAAITVAHADQHECLDFLRRAHAVEDAGRLVLHEPPIFVLEFFSVSNRSAFETRKFDRSLYPEFRLTDTTTPLRTRIEPFTEDDAHEIMNAIAARFPLQPEPTHGNKPHPYCKGGDLMYLGVARRFGCPLVTLDEGLLKYGVAGFHEIVRPAAWG